VGGLKDYYEILGIDRAASDAEIRDAYRKIAQSVHPDKGGGVDEFQAVSLAYRTLIDPDKRARYDRGEDTTIPIRTVETIARERLALMFNQFILQAKPDEDMVKVMKMTLGNGIDQALLDLKKTEASIENCLKIKKRIHYHGKDDGNVFDGVINQLIEDCGLQKTKLEQEIEIISIVQGMLKDYDCDVEKRKNTIFSGYTTSGYNTVYTGS